MATERTFELPAAAGAGDPDRGSVLFVGTATTVLRLGPFTLLTDPNFLHAGDHVHLGYGLFSKRLTNPALEVEDLPPLDACLLSHFHGDHWDRVATRKLPKDLLVLTPPEAARALRRRGFRRAHALARWEAAVLRRGEAWLRVTAMPGKHGPPVVSSLLPDVMGSMLELGRGAGLPRFRLYVSGDTLVHDELRKVPERYPHVDLGLFHLGGTRVLGVLVTMDAEQGIRAIRLVRPDVAVPIHYDDYGVFKSPLEDFVRAVETAGLASRVRYLGRGERYDFEIGRASAARDAVAARMAPRPPAPGDPLAPGHLGE
jgi:L-ascorbate metabolism protein UlaG (beta-lactamase superfamily)